MIGFETQDVISTVPDDLTGNRSLGAHGIERDESYAHLLTFFDFPAEHWAHLRTTNPIESTFATVRLRTDQTRSCVSKDTILALVFKLVESAQKRWLRIRGFKHLADVIEGVPFNDGYRMDDNPDMTQMQDAA